MVTTAGVDLLFTPIQMPRRASCATPCPRASGLRESVTAVWQPTASRGVPCAGAFGRDQSDVDRQARSQTAKPGLPDPG